MARVETNRGLMSAVRMGMVAAAGLCAAPGAADANVMIVYEYSTSTVTVLTATLLCHDAASAMIPGLVPVAVVDGYPSIAELTAPINPATGTPWSKAKGYAGCPSEKWTATIALAGMPNPFAPPKATAIIWNEVIVTSTTTVTTTATIHIRIIPERPMCLYDPGVLGAEMMNYSVYDSRFAAPIWQKNIMFNGTEAGPTMKDGTIWMPIGPIDLGEFGHFARGYAMQDSFFDIFYQVDVPPMQTLNLLFGFEGTTQLGQSNSTAPGARYAVITNTLPGQCYANCDGSSNPPVLNVNDFSCFLNRYAAGDPWANCDSSTIPPILNVNDFSCFLNKYASGCS